MAFPISVQEIAKTEAKTGFAFPAGLKARYVKENGGEVALDTDSFDLVPFLDTTDRKCLARTCNDIVRESASARQWMDFPADAFVIAQNGCGDYLIIRPVSPGSKELGETIFFWNHETGECAKVADSLDAV